MRSLIAGVYVLILAIVLGASVGEFVSHRIGALANAVAGVQSK